MADMAIDLGEITVILGQRDSGKSVLIEHLLSQMDRYVSIDHLYNHRPPGSVDVYSIEELITAWKGGETRVNVRDTSLSSESEFDRYCRLLGQIENFFLVIDEIHKWTTANYCPEVLSDLIQTHSSHGNVGIIAAARQAKSLPTELWQETNNLCVFHYGRGEDRKIQQLELSSEDKQKIHELDPNGFRFLFHRNRTGFTPRLCGPVPLPEHLTRK